MSLHHHHFYDEHGKPAYLVHDHDFINVRHLTKSLAPEVPVYWDHEGDDCEGLDGFVWPVSDPQQGGEE